MAQQYGRRYDGLASGTMAPPVLSLPSHASQALEDEPFFQMDSLEYMWQGEGFDPFWSDEIDQGQMYDQPGAHFARIEAGSAYKSLVGQLPAGTTGISGSRSETTMDDPHIDYPPFSQSSRSVPVPASPSMPRTIARSHIGVPSTAPSQRLQWASFPEQDQGVFHHDAGITLPTTHDCKLLGIPSASPFSTYSAQSPWSSQHSFAQRSGPTYAPSTPITPQSSFNIAPTDFSFKTPLSTPPANRSHLPHAKLRPRSYQGGDPHQQELCTSPFEGQSLFARDSTANLSAWAQGTYNVLDRTSFGSLAPPTTPTPRRRRASRSRTRSVATLACENCNKTFASKSERDHHTRWHGPKDRVCVDCGRGFVASKDLKRHRKTHKPSEAHEFFCSVQGCPYERRGFARKDHLTRHRKTHVANLDSSRLMSISFPF